jgi:hypothetical protein
MLPHFIKSAHPSMAPWMHFWAYHSARQRFTEAEAML